MRFVADYPGKIAQRPPVPAAQDGPCARHGFNLSAQAHGERRSDFDAYGVSLQVGYSFD